MALSAGTRIGPYEIISALGAGGMGFVLIKEPGSAGSDLPTIVVEHWLDGVRKRLGR